MFRKVYNSIKKYKLFERHEHVLVAVSGGADSMALLYVLHELSRLTHFKLTIAHLNHCLRGKAADEDAEFVRKTARKLSLPCVIGRAKVAQQARNARISVEMAARQARYKFLTSAARKLKTDIVATAHTADDQAETVLLKLTRGAGRRGLGGIPRETVMHGIRIVRPLLEINRNEIIQFLHDGNISWREDESNKSMSFLRNRIRHEILPMLETRLNPGLKRILLQTAEILRDEDQWLDNITEIALKYCLLDKTSLDIEKLGQIHIAAVRRVLRSWLVSAGVTPELLDFNTIRRVEKLLSGKTSSKKVEVTGGWLVKRQYKRLLVEHGRNACVTPDSGFRMELKVPGETILAEQGLCVLVKKEPGLTKQRGIKPGSLPACASISGTAVGRKKIYLRSWTRGDRIAPYGMTGTKKIQDIFVDAKVPLDQRGTIPMLECKGTIIWLPGYRVAKGWEVTDSTDRSLQIEIARL